MKHITQIAACVLWVLFLNSSFAQGGESPLVKLIPEDTAINVEIDGKPFTTYHFNDGMGKPYVRPFFFPVRAADGTPVTADQMTGGGDHPHHRSLWVAQGDVNGADHWAIRGSNPPKQRHLNITAEGDTIVQNLAWENNDHQPILQEKRTLRFFAWPDGARGIDFTLVFEPIDQPVTFGDTKEAGLCAVRMHKQIAAKPAITTSTGATSESAAWGKPARWCDESGTIDGKVYGVAILDHPSNPRHPTTWHVRNYGLMTANIFGLHDFDRKNPAGAGDFKMEKGKPVTFRYRVVIHPGDAGSAALEQKWQEFAGK